MVQRVSRSCLFESKAKKPGAGMLYKDSKSDSNFRFTTNDDGISAKCQLLCESQMCRSVKSTPIGLSFSLNRIEFFLSQVFSSIIALSTSNSWTSVESIASPCCNTYVRQSMGNDVIELFVVECSNLSMFSGVLNQSKNRMIHSQELVVIWWERFCLDECIDGAVFVCEFYAIYSKRNELNWSKWRFAFFSVFRTLILRILESFETFGWG